VAGRRKDYRTWDEFSASERRRGLTILGGAGIVAVGAVVLVYGGTAAGGGAPVGAPPPAVTGLAGAVVTPAATVTSPDLDEWYKAIDRHRTDIGLAEADVRKAIAESNGMALQPACVLLNTRTIAADSAGITTPAGDAGQAWAEGLRALKQATQSCAQLFDGTQVAPTVLLTETSTALDAADAAWGRLSSPDTRVADASAGSASPPAPSAPTVAG